jgi:hypothetical protein
MTATAHSTAGRVSVRSSNGFYSVAATEEIAGGEIVFLLQGYVIYSPSRYSVQIDKDRHLEPSSSDPQDPGSYLRFLNHSCSPNCYIELDDLSVRALRVIRSGEQVTFDYNTTEFDMASPFRCECNSEDCYGEIRGFIHLSVTQQMNLMPRLAPHLRSLAMTYPIN